MLSRAASAKQPIEEKESYRWVTTLRQAQQVGQACPTTQCLCVADSEADIYEVLMQGMAEAGNVDWIVRACQARAVRRRTRAKPARATSETRHSLRRRCSLKTSTCVVVGPRLLARHVVVANRGHRVRRRSRCMRRK